ncbi:hypothetical protein BDV95DRAFT_602095 [Massariosphaeria phaeospora]|uniref:Uncharacterized protein n=1 Tax=Massariosphaeria phaeospora TaxID=100035 RepID=A0A7C8ICG5_9PLEO|nr:hypothetical protein BDV95DRAFT_602095 [Massariosphaeria phaeospora]
MEAMRIPTRKPWQDSCTAQKKRIAQVVVYDPDAERAHAALLAEEGAPQEAEEACGVTWINALHNQGNDEYERWERKDLKFKRQKKALAEFNSEISKTIAAKHLYLIENKDTPHDRLTTLKKHLALSDATRQRDLIARYKGLQTPPRGRKVEE